MHYLELAELQHHYTGLRVMDPGSCGVDRRGGASVEHHDVERPHSVVGQPRAVEELDRAPKPGS